MPLDSPPPPPPEDRRETRVLAQLCALGQASGVEIRVEPFERAVAGKGGLCRIEGRPVVIVDARLGAVEQVGVVGEALGRLGLDAPPELRPYLRTGHAPVLTLVRPKPLARGRLRPRRA